MLMKGRRQLADLEARAALGIADSAFNADELTRLGYTRTSVVPILLDIAALERTPPNPAIRKLAATTWLFVGRIAPNKAQHDIVKAFAAYRRLHDPDARLRLVGGSSSHTYECALHDFIGALELGDAIEVTGAVDDATLMAYYDTSDVFVVLSEHEGFCVPLLEAMFHDLPIVAYASTAIPGTVGDAALLLQQKDAYTVAEAVARVTSDSVLRAQLVAAGKARLPEFDVARSRQKLLDAVVPVVGDAR
jgi:glycosyltransferase involved in cell wall biosynthesis